MHRLSCAKPSNDLGCVLHKENWQFVQSTLRSLDILGRLTFFWDTIDFWCVRKCVKVSDPYMVWPLWVFGDTIRIDVYTICIYGLDETSVPWAPWHLSSWVYRWHVSKRDSSPSSWEVSFGWGSVILGLCDDENEYVVNTIEREHTIAPVLKLPVEIIRYEVCIDTPW